MRELLKDLAEVLDADGTSSSADDEGFEDLEDLGGESGDHYLDTMTEIQQIQKALAETITTFIRCPRLSATQPLMTG